VDQKIAIEPAFCAKMKTVVLLLLGLFCLFQYGSSQNLGNPIQASNGQLNDQFGTSVAISGTLLVVGAPNANGTIGTIYIFTCSGSSSSSSCSQQMEIYCPNASAAAVGGNFGTAVAVNGNWVVAGAPNIGQAFLFDCTNSSGCVLGSSFAPATATVGTSFGSAVAIYGNLVVVTAPYWNYGVVYLYRCSAANDCPLQQTLTSSFQEVSLSFGTSVAIAETLLVVGAPGYGGFQGLATTYSCPETSGNCTTGQDLLAYNGTGNQFLGSSLAALPISVVAGAPNTNGHSGEVYLFQCPTPGNCEGLRDSLVDSTYGDQYGEAVALFDNLVIIGAPGAQSDKGTVIVYNCTATYLCSPYRNLTASDGVAGDEFGYSLSVSSSFIVIGAPKHKNGTGAFYIYPTPVPPPSPPTGPTNSPTSTPSSSSYLSPVAFLYLSCAILTMHI